MTAFEFVSMNSFVGTNLRCPSGLNLPATPVQIIGGEDRTVTLLDRHDAPLVLLIRRQFRIGLVHPAHDRVIIGIDCEHGVALTTTWEWHDESRHYRKNHRGHDGWKQDWESGVTWHPPYGERPQTDLIIGDGIQAENIQQALLWD